VYGAQEEEGTYLVFDALLVAMIQVAPVQEGAA
jgi:hypothetical protein